jgi:DNA-binding response OmpR family regulator
MDYEKEFLMQTILVVEDDPNQWQLYEEELSDEGYHVSHAECGREALQMMHETRPDCLVLDLNLPDIDGMEVLEKMAEMSLDLPVIINTAYAAYKDTPATLTAAAYVIKSSDLTELKVRVKEALNKANANAGLADA